MTDVLDPVIYALSHAAFGAIAVMAMGYVVMLATKLEERDLRAEAATQPEIIRDLLHYVYVYNGQDAKALSDKLDGMRGRLAFAYIGCLVIAFLIHSPDLRDFVGVDLPIIGRAAALLGLPESLIAPFGFTAYVVFQLWGRTREYLLLLGQGRRRQTAA